MRVSVEQTRSQAAPCGHEGLDGGLVDAHRVEVDDPVLEQTPQPGTPGRGGGRIPPDRRDRFTQLPARPGVGPQRGARALLHAGPIAVDLQGDAGRTAGLRLHQLITAVRSGEDLGQAPIAELEQDARREF